mmetsp:Transcript_5838/g.8573  ORF Transcript_5838/g.8573 Transcript_5838/m.8573 type:complete len:223 (-) Transcript_5838:63-731(-)
MGEHLFKILVVGDVGAGKSCIINKYIRDEFSPNYKSTIGVDFGLKMLKIPSKDSNGKDVEKVVRLQFWDIAGQERFGNMTRVYYKDAVGAFVVFDQTRKKTYDGVARWKDDIDNKVWIRENVPIPCVLLANKDDLKDKKFPLSDDELKSFTDKNNFEECFKTSAKTGDNIDKAAKALVDAILKEMGRDPSDEESDSEENSNFVLGKTPSETTQDTEKNPCKC